MSEITDLDKLQKDIAETLRALDEFSIKFNPHDSLSIEAAIQAMCQVLDDRIGQYASNPVVGPLIEQLKDEYREYITLRAEKARLQAETTQLQTKKVMLQAEDAQLQAEKARLQADIQKGQPKQE